MPDFDARPPVPVEEYEATACRVNVGYELAFELCGALLRAHLGDDAHLLIVGAGGGKELQVLGPANPRWRFTGVDPSANMLALARPKAESGGLADRVRLIQGTLDDLATDEQFEAATLLFVLMHLPDDGSKLHLLRGIAERIRPAAPLLLVDAVSDLREAFTPAWRRYAEARGMPSLQMSALVERISKSSNAVMEERELALLSEAGFRVVRRFFAAFTMNGWIATR